MSSEEILDYVMNTPGNTNYAVLKSMLNELENSGGGGTVKPFIIEYNFSYTDKTFDEIKEAFLSGKVCMFHWLSGESSNDLTNDIYYIVTGLIDSSLEVFYGANGGYFYTTDPDDYLVMPD